VSQPPRIPLPRPVVIGAAVSVVFSVALFAKAIPLGIPFEWIWPYWPAGLPRRWSPVFFVVPVLLGVLLVGALRASSRRLLRWWGNALVLVGVFALHAAFMMAAVPGFAHKESTWSAPVRMGQLIASPVSFGYYGAALEAGDAGTLLATHERLMGDPHTPERVRTHPPGPALVYLGIIAVFDSLPYYATRALEDLLGLDRLSGDELVRAIEGPLDLGLGAHEALGAVFAGYVTVLLGALAVFPVFLLGREVGGLPVGLASACLYAVTPSAVVFVPSIDAWVTTLVALSTWLMLVAARRRSAWLAAAAGAVCWAALQVSFGAIAGVLIGGAVLAVVGKTSPPSPTRTSTGRSEGPNTRRAAPSASLGAGVPPDGYPARGARDCRAGYAPRRRRARRIRPLLEKPELASVAPPLLPLREGHETERYAPSTVLLLLTFLAAPVVLSLLTWAITDYNAFHGLILSRAAHAEVTARRTYLPWLLMDPLDFAFGLGLCVAACVVATAREALGDRRRPEHVLLLLAALGTLALLDLSGTVRGEVARIWQFLMPLCIVPTVAWLSRFSPRFATASGVVFAAQFLQTLAMQANVAFMVPW
jgi:hypothetical protein